MQQAMLVRCHQVTLFEALCAGLSSRIKRCASELIQGVLNFAGYVR